MQKMFLDEVTERSARLVEGAQALRAGTVSPQEAGDLLREGHTIKGTGRVMGYDDVGSAGLMLEMIWRWIQQGDITPVPLFGRVLEGLSAAIPVALDNPAELSVAMTAVHEFFEGQELPEELPPAPQVDASATASGGDFAAVPDTGGGPVIFGEPATVSDRAAEMVEVVEPAASDEPSESEAVDADSGEAEPDAESVVDDVVSEPVMSAHDMFAQLASEEGPAAEDEPAAAPDDAAEMVEVVEPAASDEPSESEAVDADSGEAEPDAESVVDDVVSEPVMSAHDMFAQLANEEGPAAEAEVSEDHTEEGAVADAVPEPPAMDLVEGEPATESEEGDSEDDAAAEAARSAQEAFAELRRSMMQDAAAAQIAAEPEDHTDGDEAPPGPAAGGGDTTQAEGPLTAADDERADVKLVDDGGTPDAETVEPLADEELQGETAEESTVDAETPIAEASIGAVIEFPVSAADAEVDPAAADGAEPGAVAGDEPSEATDVVVLPSNRKTPQQGPSEQEDLGGLVGAVQTWAAEEPISVNTGRLYGLVNHIVTLRMNIEMVKEQLAELAEVAAADPFFSDRISHIASEIDPIADASELIEGEALALAASPLSDVTNTLPQLGRYLSRKTGKELRVEIVGNDVLVDRQVLDRLGDAIRQLVVNSAVHGIEDVDARLGAGKSGTGSIRIEAKQTDVNLEVSVVDDGRGIDWKGIGEKGLALGLLEASAELAPDTLRSLLYQSGFTTRDDADELAGDGDGLSVVRDAMESLNGSLRVESTPKVETRVSMVVPIHQAMQKALLVVAGGIMWGIPETGVLDVVEMNLATIAVADHTTVLERPDGDVPFAPFADLMG